ncbi:6-phosphogluconolactonase, eukaryotic type, partial [hydrothermal vent metagenome]
MIERHDYENPDQLALALANSVANNLRSAIGQRSIASLVVSGGSTPKLFFQTLAQLDGLDWSKIVVSLVDERWVDMSSERSNAAMVKKYLLQGPAEQALFIPLYREGKTPDI